MAFRESLMDRFTSLVIAVGVFVMVLKTVSDSNALSYLSEDPAACVNCHVMNAAYDSWQHSSHSQQTTCNSCHLPQGSILKKYAFKASDGLRHATVFSLRMEPQNFVLNEAAESVVRDNCIRCHEKVVSGFSDENHGEGRLCWDCHSSVPHGKLRSSASYTPIDHD